MISENQLKEEFRELIRQGYSRDRAFEQLKKKYLPLAERADQWLAVKQKIERSLKEGTAIAANVKGDPEKEKRSLSLWSFDYRRFYAIWRDLVRYVDSACGAIFSAVKTPVSLQERHVTENSENSEVAIAQLLLEIEQIPQEHWPRLLQIIRSFRESIVEIAPTAGHLLEEEDVSARLKEKIRLLRESAEAIAQNLEDSPEEDDSPSLQERLDFLKLPLAERRRILAEQADALVSHYQEDTEWRELMAGDIIDDDY